MIKNSDQSSLSPVFLKMKLFDSIIIGGILGFIPPVLLFLLAWWLTFALLPSTPYLPAIALMGLGLGILIDLRYLRRWVNRAYSLDLKLWMAIYLFYSVGVFGFFMGVPVFNVGLALPAGYLMARKLFNEKMDDQKRSSLIRATCFFTTGVLALICLASALFALTDPYTEANLRGMLQLSFVVTRPMVVGLILGGGTALLASEWWLTAIVMKKTYQFGSKNYQPL